MNLKDVIAEDPKITRWFAMDKKLLPSFEVEVAYVDPEALGVITKLEVEEMTRAFIKRSIVNWRGLNFKNLKILVAVSKAVDDKTEFPFSQENAFILCKKGYGFWQFIFEKATRISYFQSEDELKNL